MKKQPNGQYLYSPSDLVRFMESPFASAMERLAQEDRSYLDKRDPDDDQMKLLQKRGYAHEDNLESHFRSLDKHVIKIEGATEEEKREKTLTAMREGKDIIIQAYLCNGAFAGFADFLIKVSGKSAFGDYHYEVWDTKLAHHVKPAFVMQLCCYAEMLDVIQEKLPANITVALGSGENETFRVLDFFAYYSSLKKAFLNAQAQFNSEQLPDPADSKSWGRWSTYAESLLVEREHLFQVATITQGQIKKLNQAGILTMAQLAESPPEKVVKGINAPVFRRLQVQSRLQKASIGLSKPLFEIINSTVRN